ncbi:hypothetical protein CJP74_07880 [Psittacicella melopsittaci]|uniref:HTH deoR-type domain-containing protein n=1 Tax=Psittacicella melopsittaci TaxID=2028576 RepID=A0A3A1Y1M7_9GAMM|nr:hypothetical protein CJP74_07880 [Psittacicella melopsittaci]
MFSSYADFYKKLRFEISDNRVVITLFTPDIEKTPNKVNSSSQVKLGPKKLVRQEKILALILKDKNVSALKLAKELEVSLATIKRDLSALSAENKIEHIGGNRYGHWIVKKD